MTRGALYDQVDPAQYGGAQHHDLAFRHLLVVQ